MTGAITSGQATYIDAVITRQLTYIQSSISGSKDLITMQVKSELGTEYQKIIENANSGIANQISWFNNILV